MVKPSLRIINVTAHVPFADECRLVTRLLELFWKEREVGIHRMVIVDHSMVVGILAGQNRRATG
jgi:hypothetical protein